MKNEDNRISAQKLEQLDGIQYLRGIAAIMVVLDHTASMSALPKYFGTVFFNGWLLAGASGVDLFFVISGFIITYVALGPGWRPRMTRKQFISRRFVRIVPFMWLCVIGYAMLQYVGRGTFEPLPYLRALSLYPIGQVHPNQIWTLRHEFLFYVVFCISIMGKRPALAALLLWFLSPIALAWYSAPNQLIAFVFNDVNLLFGCGFALGCLQMHGHIGQWRITSYGTLVCLCGAVGLLIVVNAVGRDRHTNLPAVAVFATFIVYIALHIKPKRSSMAHRLGLLLGDASYAIYLTHPGIISALLGVWSRHQIAPFWMLVEVVSLLICCVVGIYIHRFIEQPIIRYSRRYIGSMLEKKRHYAATEQHDGL